MSKILSNILKLESVVDDRFTVAQNKLLMYFAKKQEFTWIDILNVSSSYRAQRQEKIFSTSL